MKGEKLSKKVMKQYEAKIERRKNLEAWSIDILFVPVGVTQLDKMT